MLAEGSTSAVPRVAGGDDHPQLLQGHLQPHDGRAARLRQRHRPSRRTARRSPASWSGSTSRCATRASPSTRRSSGRPPIVTVKDADGKVALRRRRAARLGVDNGGNKVGHASRSRTRTSPSGSSPRRARTTRSSSRARSRIELYKADTGDPVVQKSIDQGVADDDRGPDLHLRARGQVHRPQRRQGPGDAARLAGLLPPRRRLRRAPLRSLTAASGAASSPRPDGGARSPSPRSAATTAASTPSSPRSSPTSARPWRPRRRARSGSMEKMADYAFVAGILATVLALGAYILYAVSGVRAARLAAAGVPMSTGQVGFVSGPRTASIGTYATLLAWLGFILARRQPRLPDHRHRPRPVLQHVRVLDRLRLGDPGLLPAGSSASTTSASSASWPFPSRWRCSSTPSGSRRLRDRAARPGPPEQPAPDGPRRHRDRGLRLVHDRLRRRPPVPDPARVRPLGPAQAGDPRRDRLPRDRRRLPVPHPHHRPRRPLGRRRLGSATGAGTRRRPPRS